MAAEQEVQITPEQSLVGIMRPQGVSDKRWSEISQECIAKNEGLNIADINNKVNGAAPWIGTPAGIGAVVGGVAGCIAGTETGCVPGAIGGAVLGGRIGALFGVIGMSVIGGKDAEQFQSTRECVATESKGYASTIPKTDPTRTAQIAQNAREGTVHIYTPGLGSGKGFLVDPEINLGAHSCMVVTDNHVIVPSSANAYHVIRFYSSKSQFQGLYEGKVLYQDPKNDLAFLRVDGVEDPSKTCKAVLPLGNSDKARDLPVPIMTVYSNSLATGATMGFRKWTKAAEGLINEGESKPGNTEGLVTYIREVKAGDSGTPIINAEDGTVLSIVQHDMLEVPSLAGLGILRSHGYNFGASSNTINKDLEEVRHKLQGQSAETPVK